MERTTDVHGQYSIYASAYGDLDTVGGLSLEVEYGKPKGQAETESSQVTDPKLRDAVRASMTDAIRAHFDS